MPYVPPPDEVRRLRVAIEIAKFSDGERVAWLSSFAALVLLYVVLLVTDVTWAGALGGVMGMFVLYWRLRAAHLAGREPDDLRGLFGLGLGRRDQRAFTGLMLRHVLVGRNPLAPKAEHDPFATWRGRVERTPEDASA